MTLAGAAVVPAAPVLLQGVSERPPEEVAETAARVAVTLAALPPHELLLLLAAADDDAVGVHTAPVADLGGLSRPDLATSSFVPGAPAAAAAAAIGLPLRDDPLPVDLAVLLLQAARARPRGAGEAVLPVTVPWRDAGTLLDLGGAVARALSRGGPVVVLAAGDLSAGLTEKAPRHLVGGAAAWDQAAVGAVRGGDARALGALGPGEARRVAARCWPALMALHGVLDACGLVLGDVSYAAPRGVGYLIARG